jgi:hypothetical protein
MNGSLYAILLYLVLYLQNGLHYSALGTGLRLLVITVTAMTTSVLAGRLSQYVPIRWLIGPGLGLIGLGLLLMRGLHADTGWTHLILGMAIAGAGSGLVNPPLASTAVGVVQPQDAGMASGINSTFRQIGIATSVAVLGSAFDSKIGGATAATATGHYASALNEVLLIAACIAFAAGALALVLIRRKDFHAPDPAAPRPEPATQTTTDPEMRLEQQMQLENRSVAILGLSRDRTGHSNTARRARRGGNHRRSGRAPTGRCRFIPTWQCAHDRRQRTASSSLRNFFSQAGLLDDLVVTVTSCNGVGAGAAHTLANHNLATAFAGKLITHLRARRSRWPPWPSAARLP